MNYETIGKQIGQLVDDKNRIYGDAFSKTGDFLKILYPDGIKPKDYNNVLALARVFDKMMRIANGNKGNENAWNDITGYGILMSKEEERENLYVTAEQASKNITENLRKMGITNAEVSE